MHAHVHHTDAALQGSPVKAVLLQEPKRQGIQVLVPWEVTVNLLMFFYLFKDGLRYIAACGHSMFLRKDNL